MRHAVPTISRLTGGAKLITDFPGVYPNREADSFNGITNALAGLASGTEVVFPAGAQFDLSAALLLSSSHTGLKFRGKGARFYFPSDDTSLTGGAAYGSFSGNQRSAIFIDGADDVEIEGLEFYGSTNSVDVTVNIGKAVSIRTGTRLRLRNLRQFYGGGLVHGYAAATGMVVEGCYSYGSRNNTRIGDRGVIRDTTFELPTTSDYDRVGDNGSSHAIYQFSSSGDGVSIEDCRFINMRTEGVKVSGTASALRGFNVTGCKFFDCGKNSDGTDSGGFCVLMGTDQIGDAVHGSFDVSNNQTFDSQQFCNYLGHSGGKIHDNIIKHTVAPTTTVITHISVSQYQTGSTAPEVVSIDGNQFVSETATGTTVCTTAITINRVGLQLGRSSVVIGHRNHFGNGIGKSLSLTNCVAPVWEGNVSENNSTLATVTGCRMPRITGNHIIDQRSDNAQLRMNNNSWPIVDRNWTAGKLTASQNGHFSTGDNASGTTPVVFPLLGMRGLVEPSGSKPEIVLAYGDLWSTGDTVVVGGSTLTYGTNFSSLATLITAIDGVANLDAADYGATWGITTGHIRIRRSSTSATANLFTCKTTTVYPTAGVLLRNSSTGTGNQTSSRGEDVDRIVIWSPCLQHGQVPRIAAYNAAAATALTLGQPYPVWIDEANESGACITMQFAAGALTGTEQFYWEL